MVVVRGGGGGAGCAVGCVPSVKLTAHVVHEAKPQINPTAIGNLIILTKAIIFSPHPLFLSAMPATAMMTTTMVLTAMMLTTMMLTAMVMFATVMMITSTTAATAAIRPT
jgi:hypothetical protein